MVTVWHNRIVSQSNVDPATLTGNPRNFRRHPQAQHDALRGALNQIGWIQDVVVNKTTGLIVDGHLRVKLAIAEGQPTIPVKYVELTADEEALALATIDPLAAMAYHDAEALDALLADVTTDDPAVQALLDSLRVDSPTDDDWASAMGTMPDGDKSPFQQMTFTVTDDQAEQISRALDRAKDDGPFVDTGNQNSNGNALARVCETYGTVYAR